MLHATMGARRSIAADGGRVHGRGGVFRERGGFDSRVECCVRPDISPSGNALTNFTGEDAGTGSTRILHGDSEFVGRLQKAEFPMRWQGLDVRDLIMLACFSVPLWLIINRRPSAFLLLPFGVCVVL
jgi:hypothetical protein